MASDLVQQFNSIRDHCSIFILEASLSISKNQPGQGSEILKMREVRIQAFRKIDFPVTFTGGGRF